jgi:6-phosphogluconolactonase
MIPCALYENAADPAIVAWLARHLNAALQRREGPVAITVPGGATPFPIFEMLVAAPLDWRRILIVPGDDRIVPESHPASNVGKVRSIFEPVGAQVDALSADFSPPHFVLSWLGMGADGHIASLFPNMDPKADDDLTLRRLTPDPLPNEAPFDRLTLTIPALLNCDELMFVIRGDAKLALFKEALVGGNDLPVARLLAAADQPVTCFAG